MSLLRIGIDAEWSDFDIQRWIGLSSPTNLGSVYVPYPTRICGCSLLMRDRNPSCRCLQKAPALSTETDASTGSYPWVESNFKRTTGTHDRWPSLTQVLSLIASNKILLQAEPIPCSD